MIFSRELFSMRKWSYS